MKGNLYDLCFLKEVNHIRSTNESNGGLMTEGGGWKDFVLKKRPEYWLKNRYFNKVGGRQKEWSFVDLIWKLMKETFFSNLKSEELSSVV